MKKKGIIKTDILVILAIILLSILFRVYNFYPWLFFGMDQEYEALIINNILNKTHFPLIGVNISDTGLYLGPAFIYFAAIAYALFSGNPIGGAITAALIGIITTYVVYLVGKSMFDKRVGIFSSLFYSSSFLVAFYDRKFWNPTPIPLISLLIIYILNSIYKKKKVQKQLFLLAVVFSLGIQSHFSILIFTPLIFYVLWVNRHKLSRKAIFILISVFIILQLPIVIFEFRHNFHNSQAFIRLLTDRGSSSVSSLSVRSKLFLSTLGRFFWMPPRSDLFVESQQCREFAYLSKKGYPESVMISLYGLGLFLWLYFTRYYKSSRWRKSKAFKYDYHAIKLVYGVLLLSLLFIVFYSREIFEYYFLFLFPWLAILYGLSIRYIFNFTHGKLIVASAFYLFVSLNLYSLLSSTFSYSYEKKVEAIQFAKKYLDGYTYSVEALGTCPRFGGYRYLFEYFVHTPINTYMDSYFGWLYKSDISNDIPERIVLLSFIDVRDNRDIIAKAAADKVYFLSKYNLIEKRRFGEISLFILTRKT